MVNHTRDLALLYVASSLRTVAYGFMTVVLGVYLASLGQSSVEIGTLFSVALGGSAVMTIVLAGRADRWGRRRVLVIGSVLMAAAGSVFASAELFWVLALAAVLGAISPAGRDVGPFLSVEQAILAEIAPSTNRTATFARYNLFLTGSTAAGALLAGLPTLLGLGEVQGYRSLMWAYAAVGLLIALIFFQLSPRVEAGPREVAVARNRLGLHKSTGIVSRLAALFAVDSFAGGFILQGFVAYWLALRFGADASTLGVVFFVANSGAALSFLAAAPLARRIGLLRTVVFTQVPCNILLLVIPFLPSLEAAVAAVIARSLLSQLDMPTRQSYVMALVAPDERSAAAGILSVARNAAAALAPVFSGASLAAPALGIPFFVGGTIKLGYNFAIYYMFRGVHPPEEQRGSGTAS